MMLLNNLMMVPACWSERHGRSHKPARNFASSSPSQIRDFPLVLKCIRRCSGLRWIARDWHRSPLAIQFGWERMTEQQKQIWSDNSAGSLLGSCQCLVKQTLLTASSSESLCLRHSFWQSRRSREDFPLDLVGSQVPLAHQNILVACRLSIRLQHLLPSKGGTSNSCNSQDLSWSIGHGRRSTGPHYPWEMHGGLDLMPRSL